MPQAWYLSLGDQFHHNRQDDYILPFMLFFQNLKRFHAIHVLHFHVDNSNIKPHFYCGLNCYLSLDGSSDVEVPLSRLFESEAIKRLHHLGVKGLFFAFI